MKNKLTISDAVVLHLSDVKGEWIASHQFDKVTFHGKYTGTSATRRMREIAEQGYHTIQGIKYFVERRIGRGGFAEYRVTGGERTVTKTDIVMKEGIPTAVIRQEVLKV